MRGISCRLSPIPDHAFFEQAVLEGQVGHALLKGGGLPTQVLHLVRRGSPRRVAGEPLLARLQEVPTSLQSAHQTRCDEEAENAFGFRHNPPSGTVIERAKTDGVYPRGKLRLDR